MASILVVDDEYILRSFYHYLLESNGYTVVAVENGMEALRVCAERREPFDLAIIDWVMPVMGGEPLKKRLEAEYPLMPIIIASGSVDPSEVTLRSNETFLLKPFTADELLQVINDILNPAR